MIAPAVDVRRFAWLSIATAITTIALKVVAWRLTNSVGLLSDALEGSVNLVGAVVALVLISIARAPPDESHPFGHGKAEYFSAGFEGVLIAIAAVLIAIAAVDRLIHPVPLADLGVGVVVSVVAAVINGVVGQVLIRAGKRHDSMALEGDGRHLMTDVVTSVGVVVGLGLVTATGALWLDPVVALLVAANVSREAYHLMKRAADGLMDRALPDDEVAQIEATLQRFAARDHVSWTGLRTHRAGHRRFVVVDIVVPGEWSVHRGHTLLDEVEQALKSTLAGVQVITHLEPQPASSVAPVALVASPPSATPAPVSGEDQAAPPDRDRRA
jgi:cation diffusion facilitator family transporter